MLIKDPAFSSDLCQLENVLVGELPAWYDISADCSLNIKSSPCVLSVERSVACQGAPSTCRDAVSGNTNIVEKFLSPVFSPKR